MGASGSNSKHIVERTCVSCKSKKAKWELVRIVRTPEGGLEIDSRGKKAGRGAYLCRQQECWEDGLKKKRLDHALKFHISSEKREELLAYGNTITGNAIKTGACS